MRLTRRALLATLTAALTPSRGRASGPSAVVVGAGVGGLAAARALAAAGASVTVIEARDRIGGRIWTDRTMGAPVERGAGWIHGVDGNPLMRLARESAAAPVDFDYGDLALYDSGGTRFRQAWIDAAQERIDRLLEAIDEEDTGKLSLLEAIVNGDADALADPVARWILAGDTEFDIGAPLDAVSASTYDEDESFGDADAVPTAGYDRLVAALSDGIDVRLGQAATRVEFRRAGVTVGTSTGDLDCDVAVVAAPLGVLKDGTIALPPLPAAMRRAIDRLNTGSIVTVSLLFETRFWPPALQIGIAGTPPGRFPYFLNRARLGGANILTGYAAGDYARHVAEWDDDRIAADALAVLRRTFGDTISPTATIVTNWARQPFTRGAYSSPGIGAGMGDYDAFSALVGRRIAFAGEHASRYYGTVHGAYLSGLRAAKALMAER